MLCGERKHRGVRDVSARQRSCAGVVASENGHSSQEPETRPQPVLDQGCARRQLRIDPCRGVEGARARSCTFGVIDLEIGEAGSPEGIVPFTTWRQALDGLPHVRFSDATWSFLEVVLVKSEEEPS